MLIKLSKMGVEKLEIASLKLIKSLLLILLPLLLILLLLLLLLYCPLATLYALKSWIYYRYNHYSCFYQLQPPLPLHTYTTLTITTW